MLPEEQILKPHVVYANNEPLPPKTWLVAWGGLAILLLIMAVAAGLALSEMGLTGHFPYIVSTLCSTYVIVKLGRYILLVLTGDFAAIREIELHAETSQNKTEKQAEILAKQMDNQAAIEAQKEANRHVEAMQNIASELGAKVKELERNHTELRRGLVQYSTQLQRANSVQVTGNDGWTLGEPVMEPDQRAAFDWVCTLYGEDGLPHPKKVVVSKGGFLMGKMPWNADEEWPPGATTILVDGENGWRPILSKAANSANYKLNVNDYATIQEVHNCLGVVRAEGWAGR